jgi:hypothetical protein
VHPKSKKSGRPLREQDYRERPKLGQVRANGYLISYRGDRVGHDRFTVERRWLNPRTNGWFTGRIVYEVEVVAQSF